MNSVMVGMDGKGRYCPMRAKADLLVQSGLPAAAYRIDSRFDPATNETKVLGVYVTMPAAELKAKLVELEEQAAAARIARAAAREADNAEIQAKRDALDAAINAVRAAFESVAGLLPSFDQATTAALEKVEAERNGLKLLPEPRLHASANLLRDFLAAECKRLEHAEAIENADFRAKLARLGVAA